MSEKLTTISGKSNDFATRFMGSGTISAASTGVVLTLTPPSGQRVRLTHLSTQSPQEQGNIIVKFGSATIISAARINGWNPTLNRLSIGSYQQYVGGVIPIRNFNYWTGDTNESLIIEKTGNTLSAIIYYGYQFGE